MARIEIRILHLNRALRYTASSKPGDDTDRIMVFEAASLAGDEGLNGPRLRDPLPGPVFQGRLSDTGNPSESDYTLEEGDYLFSQWRPEEFASLPEALDELVRQAWWERHALSGPWIVRTVKEDGRTAVQGMRRAKA